MIPLVGKYFQVGWVVILIVPVLMVDNIARFQGKILQNDSTGNPLTLPALVVFALLQSLYVCVIALFIAKYMFTVADNGSAFCDRFTTTRTRHSKFAIGLLGCVNAVRLKSFIDSLPGYVVLLGKVGDRHKVNFIGGDNVNYDARC